MNSAQHSTYWLLPALLVVFAAYGLVEDEATEQPHKQPPAKRQALQQQLSLQDAVQEAQLACPIRDISLCQHAIQQAQQRKSEQKNAAR